MIDVTTRSAMAQRERGYRWLVEEFRKLRESRRVEAERLLGPDRGE